MCNDLYRSTGPTRRLRRAAREAGWYLARLRWRARSIDNLGGFMLCDASTGARVAGQRFNLTTADVQDWLAEWQEKQGGCVGRPAQSRPAFLSLRPTL